MKARQRKKLSKKIASILPKIYEDAWLCADVMTKAWNQGSKVSHELRVGGELDYWGEGTDDYSVFSDFCRDIDLYCYPYPQYPDGHKWEGLPDVPRRKTRFTGKVAIEHARVIAA